MYLSEEEIEKGNYSAQFLTQCKQVALSPRFCICSGSPIENDIIDQEMIFSIHEGHRKFLSKLVCLSGRKVSCT